METEKILGEKESLVLITQMITQAKDSYRDTGTAAIMWGVIIAVCSLERLAEMYFSFRLPFDIYWITIFAVIPQIMISIREKKLRSVRTYDEVYMDYIWLGFGISIGLMIVIMNVMFAVSEPAKQEYFKLTGNASAFQLREFVASFFLLLYGIPTFITGAACKFKPMLFGGLLCWACCLASLFTMLSIDYVLLAVSAIFAWFIPGLIMKKDYQKAKSELAKAHV